MAFVSEINWKIIFIKVSVIFGIIDWVGILPHKSVWSTQTIRTAEDSVCVFRYQADFDIGGYLSRCKKKCEIVINQQKTAYIKCFVTVHTPTAAPMYIIQHYIKMTGLRENLPWSVPEYLLFQVDKQEYFSAFAINYENIIIISLSGWIVLVCTAHVTRMSMNYVFPCGDWLKECVRYSIEKRRQEKKKLESLNSLRRHSFSSPRRDLCMHIIWW